MMPLEGSSAAHALPSPSSAIASGSTAWLPPTTTISQFMAANRHSLGGASGLYPSPPLSQHSSRTSPREDIAINHQPTYIPPRDGDPIKYHGAYTSGSSMRANPSIATGEATLRRRGLTQKEYSGALEHGSGSGYFDQNFGGMSPHGGGHQRALQTQHSNNATPLTNSPDLRGSTGRINIPRFSRRYTPYPSAALTLPPISQVSSDLPQARPSSQHDSDLSRPERDTDPRPETRRGRQSALWPSESQASSSTARIMTRRQARETRTAVQLASRMKSGPPQCIINLDLVDLNNPASTDHRVTAGPGHRRTMGEAPMEAPTYSSYSPLAHSRPVPSSARAGPSNQGQLTPPEKAHEPSATPTRNLRHITRTRRLQTPYNPLAGFSRKGKEKAKEEESDVAKAETKTTQVKKSVKRRRTAQPKADNNHDYVDAIFSMPGDPGEGNKWKCTCDATFGRRVDRNRHYHTTKKHQEDRKKAGRDDDVPEHTCPFPSCEETFSREDARDRHIDRWHKGENENRKTKGNRPLKKARRGGK